jgi:hypothetical protein
MEAIAKAEPPGTKTQVCSFLGLCGFYRRFVPNYAAIANRLTVLTKKGTAEKFELNSEELEAFEVLKKL